MCHLHRLNERTIGCQIGSKGAKRIGEMLEMNETLIHLNLGGEISLNIHSFFIQCLTIIDEGEVI